MWNSLYQFIIGLAFLNLTVKFGNFSPHRTLSYRLSHHHNQSSYASTSCHLSSSLSRSAFIFPSSAGAALRTHSRHPFPALLQSLVYSPLRVFPARPPAGWSTCIGPSHPVSAHPLSPPAPPTPKRRSLSHPANRLQSFISPVTAQLPHRTVCLSGLHADRHWPSIHLPHRHTHTDTMHTYNTHTNTHTDIHTDRPAGPGRVDFEAGHLASPALLHTLLRLSVFSISASLSSFRLHVPTSRKPILSLIHRLRDTSTCTHTHAHTHTYRLADKPIRLPLEVLIDNQPLSGCRRPSQLA
ncbi:unnamed protein product [Protopolystoma xenopodis]|uniref:Uncharacterized protein n=1 Tax=Protopolystoma xenopodis TaxID=117903 RepID=A0A3S5C5Y7_9PLAT|nr:unnamed protein product [Protopolystoma xenopodis]